jgi:2-polyprenyl-3-methyl-5-hydroxy-6-metoxy-1,4-benzoquinol methylase
MPPSRPWPPYCCPDHGEPLTERSDACVCPRGEVFPFMNGLPAFVEPASYADAFGLQWKRYRKTQLDSYTHLPLSRERLRRCLGEEGWAGLEDRHVLECGCGAGRFTEILLERGARVTSTDLSEAAEANRDNFPASDRHRIARADIRRLPFPPGQFDFVICLGVIQHTPWPEETISHLYAQVRPGGTFIMDHYAYSLSWYTKTAPLFRCVLKRLSPGQGLRATEKLVSWFLPLHRLVRRAVPLQMILSRISPLNTYYRAHPEMNDRLQAEWAMLDTHDGLTDWYKHRRTVAGIRRILERLGCEALWCAKGGNGVEARGRKPVARETA